MGVSILATLGETAPLWVTLQDAAGLAVADKYPQAKIFDRDGTTVIATVNLAHQANGTYWGTWMVAGASKYLVEYTVFEDAGRTIRSIEHGRDSDLIISDASGAPAPVLKGVHLNPARIP